MIQSNRFLARSGKKNSQWADQDAIIDSLLHCKSTFKKTSNDSFYGTVTCASVSHVIYFQLTAFIAIGINI